ncbi:MAG: GlxA family transcriptional regulator [Mesorhizobium sp.]
MTRSEAPSIFTQSAQPLRLTFLVFSGCSIMCVAAAVDPLRAANRIAGRTVFDWTLVSADGAPAMTTSGLPVAVSGRFDAGDRTDVLVALGGFGTRYETATSLVAGFRRAAKAARAVGGIEAGGWLLGRAGLLAGRTATTHWEDLEDFASSFPEADVRPDRYVIDGNVFTCGGAAPAFDMMLHLVRARLGAAVAVDAASVFIYDQVRPATDPQPLVSLGRLNARDPRLARAVRLMESHIAEPLTIAAIALRVGLSTRALELLFRRVLGETPGAYSLRLRLAAARRLVLDTSEPMADIAARTGFSSASAFSRAFSVAFDTPPAKMRRG